MSPTLRWIAPNILEDSLGVTYDFRWDKRLVHHPSRPYKYCLVFEDDCLWMYCVDSYKILNRLPDFIQDAYQLGVLMGDITDENIF